MKRVLILGDIHANYPALKAISRWIQGKCFDWIINTGDFLVYSTFPNETVKWFRKKRNCRCILGNTDRRVLSILNGQKLKRPKKMEKRVMYFWTSKVLRPKNRKYLETLPDRDEVSINNVSIGIFHGTMHDADEQLFPEAPGHRFRRLAEGSPHRVHIMGHSHAPYYKVVSGVHFINPGSVGRMFDGDNRVSFAIAAVSSTGIAVEHFRIPYAVEKVINGLNRHRLPPIYAKMYRKGRKLN